MDGRINTRVVDYTFRLYISQHIKLYVNSLRVHFINMHSHAFTVHVGITRVLNGSRCSLKFEKTN
jgi:hypothetical protein